MGTASFSSSSSLLKYPLLQNSRVESLPKLRFMKGPVCVRAPGGRGGARGGKQTLVKNPRHILPLLAHSMSKAVENKVKQWLIGWWNVGPGLGALMARFGLGCTTGCRGHWGGEDSKCPGLPEGREGRFLEDRDLGSDPGSSHPNPLPWSKSPSLRFSSLKIRTP